MHTRQTKHGRVCTIFLGNHVEWSGVEWGMFWRAWLNDCGVIWHYNIKRLGRSGEDLARGTVGIQCKWDEKDCHFKSDIPSMFGWTGQRTVADSTTVINVYILWMYTPSTSKTGFQSHLKRMKDHVGRPWQEPYFELASNLCNRPKSILKLWDGKDVFNTEILWNVGCSALCPKYIISTFRSGKKLHR